MNECRCIFPYVNNKKPLILHIPTDREVKGTPFVLKAIDRMKAEGLSFDFRLQEPNLTQRQVRELLSTADIIVDELRGGAHGITAAEAMACGKPILTYIRDDLIKKYPSDMPIVSANPDNIFERLNELVLDDKLRHETGKKGRAYVEKYHSLEVIGPELLKIYSEIGLKVDELRRTIPNKSGTDSELRAQKSEFSLS